MKLALLSALSTLSAAAVLATAPSAHAADAPTARAPDTSAARSADTSAGRAADMPGERVAEAAPRDDDDPAPGYVRPHIVPYLGGRIPENAHIETRPDWSLVKAGLWTLGSTYVLSLAYALETCGAQMQCRGGSAFLYVPVVGPYFTAGQAPTTGGQALSVFDGVAQSVGAALVLAGLAFPDKFVVWQDKSTAAAVTPVPMVGGAGLVLTVQ